MFRRLTAVLAVLALALCASTSLLHVHRYVGHDHPEHHHGPAVHAHGPADHHHRDASSLVDREADALRFEACEPGEHALSIVFTCISVDSHAAPDVPSGVAAVLVPGAPRWLRITPSDVRVHGPPGIEHASLRAPPAAPLA